MTSRHSRICRCNRDWWWKALRRRGSRLPFSGKTVNAGSVPVIDSFSERIRVQNGSTGQQILNTLVPVAIDPVDPIENGEVINGQFSFDLPDGLPGAGNIVVTITTDAQDNVVESFGADVPESNNDLSFSFTSNLPPYPDLVVSSPLATPDSLQTGEELELTWTVENIGTAAVSMDFDQRVRVVRRSSGQTLVNTVVPYNVAVGGVIDIGGTKAQTETLRIPDGSDSVGELDITITVDSSSAIFELNAGGDAETNNSAATTATASLAPYPDLALSNVTAPTQTIADPANVTVSWRVENIGELAAQPGGWFDAVIASTDEIVGDGDDRVVARFGKNQCTWDRRVLHAAPRRSSCRPALQGDITCMSRRTRTAPTLRTVVLTTITTELRTSSTSCRFRTRTCW